MLAVRLAPVAVRLAPAVGKRLARRTGRSKEFHAKKAIQEHLDNIEDAEIAIEDAEIALQRLRKPMRRETLEEVARRLNVGEPRCAANGRPESRAGSAVPTGRLNSTPTGASGTGKAWPCSSTANPPERGETLRLLSKRSARSDDPTRFGKALTGPNAGPGR
ncbi:MAG: hypothetical protein JSR91_15605 [Proteobacteria bacterium]|nr:hypothetical protein [Pseudomonadota bacterium]